MSLVYIYEQTVLWWLHVLSFCFTTSGLGYWGAGVLSGVSGWLSLGSGYFDDVDAVKHCHRQNIKIVCVFFRFFDVATYSSVRSATPKPSDVLCNCSAANESVSIRQLFWIFIADELLEWTDLCEAKLDCHGVHIFYATCYRCYFADALLQTFYIW